MPRIGVFGAGSIGCYVGGCLAAHGSDVLFIGRPRIGKELSEHGLQLSDYRGRQAHIPEADIRFSSDPQRCTDVDLLLVCVKSAATLEVADELAENLPSHAPIISFQNGLGNARALAEKLPQHRVIAGMVPFNVVHHGPGQFHQASQGELECARDAALQTWLTAFHAAGLPILQHDDMQAVLWAKLLLNLNNAINALCGLPLKQELSQRSFRCCLALAQQETLDLLDLAQIRPARITPLPPHWLPRLLTVPDFVFRLLANKMLEIDPQARSSMWEDLERGRATEIDWINGEVIKLAEQLGRQAPVNTRLVSLIRRAESGGRRDWSGGELLAQLHAARCPA